MTRLLIDEEVAGREKKVSTLLLDKSFSLSQGESVNSLDKLEGLDKHSRRWFKILQKCLFVFALVFGGEI